MSSSLRQSCRAVALLCVAALVAGGCRSERAQPAPITGAGPGHPSVARVWVGPMPFSSGRALRPDFATVLGDPQAWPEVLARADVFKSYIMLLPEVPLSGKTTPEVSTAHLQALADLLRRRRLQTAFEVGGLRQGDALPRRGEWGRQVAANELTHLRRWLAAGGRIDYLTTDHALMMNIGSFYYSPGFRDCGLSLAEAAGELADYFQALHAAIPDAKFGVIESLGFFHVSGPNGRVYVRTVPKLPVWRFEDYLETLLAAMAQRGLTLDHFHIDFGYEGVLHDGGGPAAGTLDYGRIRGVERCLQARGVRAGVIVNAFHDTRVETPEPDTANREAAANTERFWRGYVDAGGRAEDLVFQTWQPFPDRTGPESDPDTVLGLYRRLLPDRARTDAP